MMEAPTAKRAAEDQLLPLEHPGILDEVLAFVGPGHFAFVGAVSQSFRAGALKVASQERLDYDEDGDDIDVDLLPDMTTHEAIFAAPSRLRWAIKSGFVLKTDDWRVQHWAGWHADVDVLLMLHGTYGMQWTESTSRGAAESANVNKLRWLLDEQRCPQAEDICDCAAAACDTETLAWLKERGCVFTANTCARAAVTDDAVSVLEYLRDAGCEWDECTANNAASYGDLKLLQWLQKQGAPWSAGTVCEAANSGHLDTVIWLLNNGCPCDYTELLSSAAAGGSSNVLQWLKECGAVEWTPAALSLALSSAAICDELDACKVSSLHCKLWQYSRGSGDARCCQLCKQGCYTWAVICYNVSTVASSSLCCNTMPFNSSSAAALQRQRPNCTPLAYCASPAVGRARLVISALTHLRAHTVTASVVLYIYAQWLRTEGAAWPAALQHVGYAWSAEAIAWCRTEGCDSPVGPLQLVFDEDDVAELAELL
jgi:hypothetical protein